MVNSYKCPGACNNELMNYKDSMYEFAIKDPIIYKKYGSPLRSDAPKFNFVMACNEKFYKHAKATIASIESVFANYRIILFDLGGTANNSDYMAEISATRNLEFRQFNMSQLPSNLQDLDYFAWKILIIAEMFEELKPEDFMWADSSIYFKSDDFGSVYDVMMLKRCCAGIMPTHPSMFTYIKPYPNMNTQMVEANLIIIRRTETTRQLLKWAVLCALTKECIEPADYKVGCEWETQHPKYAPPPVGICHLQDQSLFNILVKNLEIDIGKAVDRLPYWSVESNRKAVNRLDTSLLRSGNVLANSLALLAYTSNTSVYRIWRTEFNFDDLTNWLVEQQTANREFENAIDTYFGARSLYSYHLTQMPRGLHAGITGNISSANLSSVRQFDAKELPFSLSVSLDAPTTTSVYLSSKGDGRLLLGVRVITERRRRSKRDPTDIYPVTIRLSQSRNPGNLSHILQTVTIVLHSSMIKHLEIQHGLFTGFSTQATNVELLSGSAKLEPPKVSSTAVHFLLRDIEKEGAVTYAVTVIEPPTNYSPENLAPIAISAICHSVMGRLIVLPSSLSFGAISNMDDNSQDDDDIVALNGLARTFVSSGPEAYRLDDENGEGAKQGNGMSVASNLQTISADLVETVCLPNGACICAEMTCSSLRCTNCSTLSFNSLCDELRQPTRFAIIFRITDSRSAKQEEAAYSVFDIKILDWYGDVVDAPDQMTIWLRNCNLQCISMTSSVDNSSSKPSAAPPKSMSSMAQVTTTKSMLRTHYVLRDSDRLAKSTDCWPLFGRPQSDDEEDQKRQADRDRKKAEVRKRLEEAGRMKKAKKGFLTPERKKKLRKLLMLKAAEDLKQQQMLKEQERQRILAERILPLPDLDSMSEAEWHKVGQEFVDRITELESASYDLSYKVRQKDFEINELSIAVNDLRGKFVKPTLKKVSKTDSQFDKIKKKGESKVDFRNNLKTVDKKQFVIEEKEEKTKVEWSKN
uniref:Uncharacterized protein n=1 Tax=Ditylenchus dipsaci TaxID=166011 RepID=A0A915ER82_9BILA